MNNFTFHIPTHFVFGRDAETLIGEKMQEAGLNSVLIVYGQGSVVRSGLLATVIKALDHAGIGHVELGGIVPNPVDGPVYEGIRLVREHRLDCVLGLGGASALDTAKAIAVGVPYPGDFWDFYAGKATVKEALPILSIPTIAAAGSESSNSSVITKEALPLKRGIKTEKIRPAMALMNPVLTYTVPKEHKSYGVADMMAHIFERYFTNTADVSLSDEMCEGVLRAVMAAGKAMMASENDYAAHADLMWAGTLAHNDTLSPGRQQDWSCHGIGHGISARFGAPHGAALAVLYPAWMRHQLSHDVPRFYRFATKVMGVPEDPDKEKAAIAGIDKLRAYFDSLGLPDSLSAFGITADDIPQLVRDVGYNKDGEIGFFKPLKPADVEQIYRSALL